MSKRRTSVSPKEVLIRIIIIATRPLHSYPNYLLIFQLRRADSRMDTDPLTPACSSREVLIGEIDAASIRDDRAENPALRTYVRRVAALAGQPFLGVRLGRPRNHRHSSGWPARDRGSRAVHSFVHGLPAGRENARHERLPDLEPGTGRGSDVPCRFEQPLETQLERNRSGRPRQRLFQ